MIELSDKYLIDVGTNRACYEHPNDQNKCIKIVISGNNKESKQEIKYYKYLIKKNIAWKHIARYYGLIETNLGIGEVVELIRDFDGNISKPLSYYIIKNSLIESNILESLLVNLKNYLFQEKIIVKDLNVVNIVYKKVTHDDSILVIIDGLNNSFSIKNNINYFKVKTIKNIWKSFINSLYNAEVYKYIKNI